MLTLEEAAELALALPEVEEGESRGRRTWAVRGKKFAWERPFSKADITRFGDATPPPEPILGVSVQDLGEKEAVLADPPPGFFTISHFDGYPALLIELGAASPDDVRDALVDAWLCAAPKALADGWLESRDD